ncbi:AsmA family protein [Roseibium hamelinense]|uniref:AsmA family protein n=1 Tax=Roseibium hamelinense TaxID=150831 RepID=UPI00119EC049|nr:AsmA-like C-terminal region-containing protein [Roseibium hamelinense]MTI45403.1 AsmA family protein [Roseibium hamelinense]
MGVAVILVLVTALVGPFFVDWTVYRSTFESYAERVLGHKVTVLGEADLRLLPSPAITFSDVRVGAAEDPLLVVSSFDMRVELPPLMKGEIRVLDMTLDRPHLTVSLDEDGRLDWLTAMSSGGMLAELPPDNVTFEKVSVVDGAVSVVDARSGEVHRLENAQLALSARSLAGPYKVDGTFLHNRAPYTVGVATGRRQADGALRVKAQLTPTNVPLDLAVDGLLSHSEEVPTYKGTFNLVSLSFDEQVSRTWQTSGNFDADVEGIAIPEFEFRFGPEDRLLGADGSADLHFAGKRRFEIRARAKQLDLDRLLGGGPQEPAKLSSLSSDLSASLKNVPMPDMEGVLALDFPAVVVGGGLVQDVKLDLETMLGGWRVARFAARAPGRTTFATQGDLGLSPNTTYRGRLSVSSEQPGALVSWWQQSETGSTTIQPIALEGRVTVVPDGAALDDLDLSLAGAEARGGISYQVPKTGSPVLDLTLDAQKLNFDEAEVLAGLLLPLLQDGPDLAEGRERAADIAVQLRAREVSVRGIDGKSLSLQAAYSGGDLRIDRLVARDFAGADVDVSGEVDALLSAPEGRLSGSLDARDLTGIIALVEGMAPDHPLTARLRRAAPFLVPTAFEGELSAAAKGSSSDVRLALNGSAGSAELTLSGAFNGRVDAWPQAQIDLDALLSGPSGSTLLQQIGLDILPVDSLSAGQISVRASGRPENGLSTTVSAEIGGSSLKGEGQVVLGQDEPVSYELDVSASSPDLTPFALAVGRVLPIMSGDIPARIVFQATGNGSEISVFELDGEIAGVSFFGGIAGRLSPLSGEAYRRLTGSVDVSELDLKALSEAVLGPDQWYSAGDGTSIWPTSAFGAPLLADTDLSLSLTTGLMQFDDMANVENVTAALRLTPDYLRLEGITGNYADGKLEAALTIRRTGAEGAFSGRIKLSNADVSDLVWRRAGRPVGSGLLDLFVEAEGAGRSISSMISGLTGGGTFEVSNGSLRGINPQAFPLVMRAVDAGLELRDDRIRDLFLSHMDTGNLAFSNLEGTITIVGGRANARNISVDAERAEVFGSAELDLNTWELDSDFSLTVDPGEEAVTGAEPQVGLLFQGDASSPGRQVDIAPFTAYLTLRAFEKEVERVEKLQSEILENDKFLRELRRLKEERARRAREAEAAAQAAEEAAGESEDLPVEDTQTGIPQETEDPGADRAALPVPVPLPATAPPAEAETAVTPGVDFADQIRSVLGRVNTRQPNAVETGEADIQTDAITGSLPATLQPGTSSNSLDAGLAPIDPPQAVPARGFEGTDNLDSPQTIEDVLARDIGLPPEAVGGPPDPVINASPDPQDPLAARRQFLNQQPDNDNARPRYRTLPNGLVFEIPN